MTYQQNYQRTESVTNVTKVWRVVPRTDKLGNQLWSLQYDVTWPGGVRYGLWREDRVFRDEGRAMEDLALVSPT